MWPFCKVDILCAIHLSHGVPRELNNVGLGNNTTDGYPKISIDTVEILVKVCGVIVFTLLTQRIILSFVKILSAKISGQQMEKTVWSSGAAPIPCGSNSPIIYCEMHQTQYMCWFKQGSWRPKSRSLSKLADTEAKSGNSGNWKSSLHIPQVRWTWAKPFPVESLISTAKNDSSGT